MLNTAFVGLSDADFRTLVSEGTAKPVQRGNSLFVAKWIDGPGMDPELFLTALRQQGSSLEVRRYESDVNVRVVEGARPANSGRKPRSLARSP
jgi:hypothetical protein